MTRSALLASLGALLLTATAAPALASTPAVGPSALPRVSVDRVITTGLEAPWGLAFLPDGSALVSERDSGRIVRVPADGGRAVVVGRVRGMIPSGEGGLLGIAVQPGPAPTAVFAYITTARDNRVVRIAWNGRRLGDQRSILTGIPKNVYHDGGRITFGPDGMLYIATGDAGVPALSQQRGSLAGKILRVTPEGRPAPGNPSQGSAVLSLGHRNVQGLAFDSAGDLWASEFGERDVDELNLIIPGRNYGWPLFEGAGGDPRYVDPEVEWSPTSTASPSGLAILDDVAYVASLRGQVLWQVDVAGGRAGEPRALPLGDLGRLRTVSVAPDGSLWLITNNTDGRGDPRPRDDRIVRLTVR